MATPGEDVDGPTRPPPPMDVGAFGRQSLLERAKHAVRAPQQQPQYHQPVQQQQPQAPAPVLPATHMVGAPPLLAPSLPLSAKYSVHDIGAAAQRKVIAEARAKEGLAEPPKIVRPGQAPQARVRAPAGPVALPAKGKMTLGQLAESRGILMPASSEVEPVNEDDEPAGTTGSGAEAMANLNEGDGWSPASVLKRTAHLTRRGAAPVEQEADHGNRPSMAAAVLGKLPRRRAP
jgi:hypothetical protein